MLRNRVTEQEHHEGTLNPEARLQQQVVKVFGIGPERGLAAQATADDGPEEFEYRQAHQPKGIDGRESEASRRSLRARGLTGTDADPCQGHPQQGAACIAHEAAHAPIAARGQIEEQESRRRRSDDSADRRQVMLAGVPGGPAQGQQSHEGHGSGQPVHAIEHIEGIDGGHDEQHRQALAQHPVELNIADSKSVSN